MRETEIKSRFNKLIETTVGLSVKDIKDRSSEETSRFIEKREGLSLKLGDSNARQMYRGNMLLALGRISQEVDAEYNKTFI